MVHMDHQGDAEGNYTLVGRQPDPAKPGEFGLFPVGVFRYSGDYGGLPVSGGGGLNYLFIYSIIFLFIDLFTYLFTHFIIYFLFYYLFIHLFIYLFISLF